MVEERIAIAKMITNTDKDGSVNLDRFKIYDRTKAIKKMARAICKSWLKGGCDVCKHKDKSCKEYIEKNMRIAEAALNALLEK